MIIYNVTIKVDWPIHEEWLHWMKDEYIPDILATKHFHHYQMLRLLQVDETDGPTYAVQYFADSLGDWDEYIANLAERQRQKGIDKWGNQFVDFSTLMEVVH